MPNDRRFLRLVCGWLIVLAASALAENPSPTRPIRTAILIGVDPTTIPRLTAVMSDAGFSVQPGDDAAAPPAGSLVILQPGRDVSDAVAKRLGEHVRHGGSLLLLLPVQPTIAPLRLAFMLPTTAWKTYEPRGFGGPIAAGEFDPDFFHDMPAAAKLPLPGHIDIRPVHAVERGQARYERFAHNVQGDEYLKQPQKPGDTFWTRPLINRDWAIRIRGDNQAADGLLVTGQYGAGRVAVFGAGIDQLEAWAAVSPSVTSAIIKWLATPALPTSSRAITLRVTHEVDLAHRQITVDVTNTSSSPAEATVLARLLTWEGTFVADVSQSIQLAAGETSRATLTIPTIDATSFQALDHADAWDVRLGLLTNGGQDVTGESRFPIDFRPDPLITVSLDDLYAGSYPFNAPHPENMPHFQARMGAGVMRYVYKPGETAHVTVRVANGVRNIAPQAKVTDLVKPTNPSVIALTDGHTKSDQPPTMTLVAYGTWSGAEKQDNALDFTWPESRTISGVTLIGAADDYRKALRKNPSSAIVEIDGKEVTRADDLDKRFPAEAGRVRLAYPPTAGKKLTLRLPWNSADPHGAVLGEVEIDGSDPAIALAAPTTMPSAIDGPIDVKLIDAETNAVIVDQPSPLHVGGDEVGFATVPCTMPSVTGPHAYRVEATLAGRTAEVPLLVNDPAHPLHDIADLNPPGAITSGYIVTRGFRNFFDIGTGTQETPGAWEEPDDLIWAYEHLLKQEGAKSETKANRLYVSSNDFKHYSTPWRTFPDGESVMKLGGENLLASESKQDGWKDATVFRYEFSDRWDTGPSLDQLHSWQDFTEFDKYLRHTTGHGLTGKTRPELVKEIHEQHQAEWMAYQKAAYLQALHDLVDPFKAAGKTVYISAQGVPLVAGPDADFIYQTVRGMSDDSTWGMAGENLPLTTARQMGTLAFNPSAAMSTLFMWGWDSAILNNPFWRVPVGTTEPSRRTQYDRAWRGTIGWDGTYQSIHTYGYNANGGTSYQMHGNDWQELWRAEERLALLPPEAPIGVGVVISTATLTDPKTMSFNGAGGDAATGAGQILDLVPNAVRRLQEAGVSVPFAANASTLKNWKGDSPLVLLNLQDFSDDELATVKSLRDRGVKLIVLASPDDQAKWSAAAKLLIHLPTTMPTTPIDDAVVTDDGTILYSADAHDLTADQAAVLRTKMAAAGELPITFAAGTGGYGFVSGGATFIVVEDWREQPRAIALRVRAPAGAQHASAVEMNGHHSLPIKRDGGDWVIELSTRPGDATLVMLREDAK